MNRLTYSLTASNQLLLDEVVNPVLNKLLKEGELQGVHIRRAKGGDILAVVSAGGETFELLLWYAGCEDTVEETRAGFYSELQDALAESSFAWGELRE